MVKFSAGDRVRVYGWVQMHHSPYKPRGGGPATVKYIEDHVLIHVKFDDDETHYSASPKQCRKLKPRNPKGKPIDWAKEAFECLNHGAELMTIEQLSQWTGVRAVIESYPEGSRVISKAELEKAYRNAYHLERFHAVSEYFENMSEALGFESEGK